MGVSRNKENEQDNKHTGNNDNKEDTTSGPVEAVNQNNERQVSGEAEGHGNSEETSTGSVEAANQNNNPGQSSKEAEGQDDKRENIKDTENVSIPNDEERQDRDEAKHPSNNQNMDTAEVPLCNDEKKQACLQAKHPSDNVKSDDQKASEDWKSVIILSIFISIGVVLLLARWYFLQDFKSADTFQNALTYTDDDKEELGISVEEASKIISSFKYAEYHENNMCDLFQSFTEFDQLLEVLGEELKLPEHMIKGLQLAKFARTRMKAIDSFYHVKHNGTGHLVFGRFKSERKVKLNGKVEYDLAYSIHSLSYKLAEENLKESVSLWNKFLGRGNRTKAVVSPTDGFFAYFQNKAIEKFNRKCSKLLMGGAKLSINMTTVQQQEQKEHHGTDHLDEN